MTDYEYQCSWCKNKVVLNVDHLIHLICPICEKRMLEPTYPEANEDITEVFRRVLDNRYEPR